MEKKKIPKISVAKEYVKMKTDREPYVTAAKEAAKYSIPTILPDDLNIHTKNNTKKKIVQPNQSVAADGVNNLAAKVTTTLLPPNQTFFKFKMDKAELKQIAREQGYQEEELSQYEAEINAGLANLETMLLEYQETFSDRACLGEALKHLYITGNVLLVFEPNEGLKYYPINRYVIKRDYCGHPQKVITEEKIGFLELPEKFQEEIIKKRSEDLAFNNSSGNCKLEEKEFILYTKYYKSKNNWCTYQEVDEIVIEGTQGKYPIDICPFIALRYVRVDGESYGRGLIEDYFGDISYLDVLSKAIKEASLAAAKLIILVNPAGQTSIRKLANTENGGFTTGLASDVSILQSNKYYDLQTAQQMAAVIEQRLNKIFCMKAAIQREAERVTAEEIRIMAADLEEALGNHYALMSKEFQLAYTEITYYHLRKLKKNLIPDLLREKSIKLTITTGLEALGRTSDLNKLVTFFNVLGQMAQSAQIAGAKTDKLISLVAASLNLDVTGMFYSEEEKQQMQQQAMQEAQQGEITKAIAPQIAQGVMEQQGKPLEE